MGVPVLALFFCENKIRESCHSRNLNPSKFMPYTVFFAYYSKKTCHNSLESRVEETENQTKFQQVEKRHNPWSKR